MRLIILLLLLIPSVHAFETTNVTGHQALVKSDSYGISISHTAYHGLVATTGVTIYNGSVPRKSSAHTIPPFAGTPAPHGGWPAIPVNISDTAVIWIIGALVFYYFGRKQAWPSYIFLTIGIAYSTLLFTFLTPQIAVPLWSICILSTIIFATRRMTSKFINTPS